MAAPGGELPAEFSNCWCAAAVPVAVRFVKCSSVVRKEAGTQMSVSRWVLLASLLAASAVALGAFGAHGLKDRLDPEALEAFDVGVRYQMYHALGLLAVAWVRSLGSSRWADTAAGLMLTGVVLFSGSLYGLTLMGWKWLGPVTPIGGVSLMLSWILLAVAAWGIDSPRPIRQMESGT